MIKKKTPAKKISKKVIKKAPAKKVAVKPAKKTAKKASKKVAKKLMKKVAKKVTKKIIAKKSVKKVAKKLSLAKVRQDYSSVTFDQPESNDIQTISNDVMLQNDQPLSFADQIRANAKKDALKFPVVHMKCRRGFDKASHGQSCKSMRAYKLAADGSQVAQFKCVDCGFSWAVGLGGSINI
jgi:hypothetical protein